VCDLNKLLREYLKSPELKRPVEAHPGITLHTDFAPDLFTLDCSTIHIRKCLLNLFINACEAIGKAGTVTISTSNRYIDKPLKGYDEVRRGEYVVLSVADTGSGISSVDIDHIFEPFYSKKVMGRSGTGLGLAVVWSAVQDHNGYIDITTNDQGTRFDLYFPASRELVDDGKEQITLQDLQGKGQTVLVVDDEATQRDIATSLLTKLGYQPSSVSSGEEAVSYLKTHKVDLLVLDMIMDPGMNGRKTYEQIISLHPGQKAIIASGFSETDEVKKAHNLGAGIFIKKPYTINQLGKAVKQELEA
jgi:CheY-like chemotaxis protein